MNKVTDAYESYVLEQHRVRNTRTNAVTFHYFKLTGPFFVVNLNQIVRCMIKRTGMSGILPNRAIPIYIPVTSSLLEEITLRFGKPLKLPHVKISYRLKLLVVHREMIQSPISSLAEVISLMNNFKTTNLVDSEQHLAEVASIQMALKLVAQRYKEVVDHDSSAP